MFSVSSGIYANLCIVKIKLDACFSTSIYFSFCPDILLWPPQVVGLSSFCLFVKYILADPKYMDISNSFAITFSRLHIRSLTSNIDLQNVLEHNIL